VEGAPDPGQRVGHDRVKRFLTGRCDPAAQRDFDHAYRGFGHHGGGPIIDTPVAERIGDGVDQCLHLAKFAFAEPVVGVDDGLAQLQLLQSALERRREGWQPLRNDVDGAEVRRGLEHESGREGRELVGVGEQYFAFVGEVAVEGARAEPGTGGDLGDGHPVEAVLEEELQRRVLEPVPRVRFPTTHAAIVDDTACHPVYSDDTACHAEPIDSQTVAARGAERRMRVFVTGATGFIGSAVVGELIGRGHQVLGLARSDVAAAALIAAGAVPHRGSVEDPESLRRGAAQADAAIHTAFFHQFSHAAFATRLRVVLGGSPRRVVPRFLAAAVATDRTAITTIGQALGPGRPFVSTFGTLALPAGRVATEDLDVDPAAVGGPRGATEQAVADLAGSGVRACLVRLPPLVHGDGDHGFLPQIIGYARKYGVSGYAGEGGNRWPSVHRLDAARLFVQALENGQAGARYHGVADEGVPFLEIASAIGRHLALPVAAASPEQVRKRFSFLASFIGTDNPTSSSLTTGRLGWKPTEVSLLEDIEHGNYFRSQR